MSLPPLLPPNNSHTFVRGDVTIHPSVAIAPGVILQAESGSKIVIAAGGCIGMGAILHVTEGMLEIEESVTLGAGVLVIGHGKIGANASIGSSATIFNGSVERGQTVPPGSIVGDTSRQVVLNNSSEDSDSASSEPDSHQPVSSVAQVAIATSEISASLSSSAVSESSEDTTKVYGQAYINRLLNTLLPHRKALSLPLSDSQSPSNDA